MRVTDTFVDTVIESLRDVSERFILPAFTSLDEINVQSKSSPHDLVTDADIAAEKSLEGILTSLLPEAVFIGEEAVSRNPDLMKDIGKAPATILVDPIDGTWNFANGIPVFSTMIAVMKGSETVFGCIFDPLTREALLTIKGAGTELRSMNLAPSKNAQTDSQKNITGSGAGFMNLMQYPRPLRPSVISACEDLGYVRSLHCSAVEYKLTATGRVNFNISRSAMPWDHAAGALAVCEAGGDVRFLDGAPYSPIRSKGPVVAAGSKDLCSHLLKKFEFIGGELNVSE
jgi:fructose-1,6-bisphosphatase/inositol monophosphatase family enzyme